jgi:hypothetical protein
MIRQCKQQKWHQHGGNLSPCDDLPSALFPLCFTFYKLSPTPHFARLLPPSNLFGINLFSYGHSFATSLCSCHFFREAAMPKLSNAILFVGFFFGSALHFPVPTNAAPPQQPCDNSATASPRSKIPHQKFVVYKNRKYGFKLDLPKTWKGYTVLVSTWEGGVPEDELGNFVMAESGPLISIRDPLWSEQDPRQDIPIMVFTHAQWALIEDDRLIISAAPIGPSEIARNSNYVFATPPRYNYALATGWQEVAQLIQQHPIQPL